MPVDPRFPTSNAAADNPHYLSHREIVVVLIGLMAGVRTAFTSALTDVFLVGVPVVAPALVVALFLKELPLRTGARRVPAESPQAEALSARV